MEEEKDALYRRGYQEGVLDAIEVVKEHCLDAYSDMEGRDFEEFILSERDFCLLLVTLQRLADKLRVEISIEEGVIKPREGT